MEKIFSVLMMVLRFIFTALPLQQSISIIEIENIYNPQQIIWESEDVIIFVSKGEVWKYVVSERESSLVREREPNEFIGIGRDGEILSCVFEHFTINSMDEFSTKLTVFENEYYFFETVRPIFLNEEEIIAVTAMDFLERHFYRIDISSGEMEEIEEPKEDIYLAKRYLYNTKRYVVENIFGNLYVYVRNPSVMDYLNLFNQTVYNPMVERS